MIAQEISLSPFSNFLLMHFPYTGEQNNNIIDDKLRSNSIKENYSPEECNKKEKNASKRKFFTQYEDQLLTVAVEIHNQTSWNDIAQCVPGKTPKQCRDRWVNYLRPTLKFGPWTAQEDQLLLSIVNKNGTHWSNMKKFFPNRSTNALKNRWNWLIKNQMKLLPFLSAKNNLNSILSSNRINSDTKTFSAQNQNGHKIAYNAKNSINNTKNECAISDNFPKSKIEEKTNFNFDLLFTDDDLLAFEQDKLCW